MSGVHPRIAPAPGGVGCMVELNSPTAVSNGISTGHRRSPVTSQSVPLSVDVLWTDLRDTYLR